MAKQRIKSHMQMLEEQAKPKEARMKEKSSGVSAYRIWHSRIAAAIRWRQGHWNGDEAWKRAYRLYGGKHWRYQDEENPSADEARDLITVNVTMSTINNMVPFLINSDPMAVLTARKPEGVVSAMLQQEILNYNIDYLWFIDQVKQAQFDATIIGHGIIKTGFTYELDQAVSKQTGSIVYEDYIKEETPYARRINPFCFIYDPTASDRTPATARWCGEIFFDYFDDVVENSRYSAKIRNKIKSGAYSPKVIDSQEEYSEELISSSDSIYDDLTESPLRIIKLFEIWDKKFRKYYIFADGVEEPLLEEDWPYDYLRGFPYRRLDFIRLPNEHYPVGLPYVFEDQQYELDRQRTQMFQGRRRHARMYEVLDSVDESERQKLLTGEDGSYVVTRQMESVRPIDMAPLSSDVWNIEGIIKQDIQELSGLDQLMRGGALPSRTTGMEVNTRTNVFRAKIDDLVSRTDRFIHDILLDVLAHIKANYVRERVVKLVGNQGIYWVNVTAEDIQAEVDIKLESVAAPRTDPTLQLQQALQLLQITTQLMAQAAQMQQPLQVNINELYAWVLEKFGNKDVGRFFARAQQTTPPLQPQQPQSSNGQISNNLNPFGTTPESPMTATQLQQQMGMASIMNAGGLQL